MRKEINYQELLNYWDIKINKILRDKIIIGSSFRTVDRFVVEDSKSNFYVVEKIKYLKYKHKKQIIKTLKTLEQNGVKKLISYKKAKTGDYIVEYLNRYWQVRKYVFGKKLKRPAYVNDGWRGKLLANFLIDLRKNSGNIPKESFESDFKISNYANEVFNNKDKDVRLKKYDLSKFEDFMKTKFVDLEDKFPIKFSHGDFHPLNVIWNNNNIMSVIDWEFMGNKPEIYDVANLLGCIGLESFDGFNSKLKIELMKTLLAEDYFSEISQKHLINYIIALRIGGWLSLWLRINDQEMIEMEMIYIEFLINNHQRLNHILFSI